MLIGYMRVSSDSDRQTTDLQRDALLSAGVDSRHLTNLAADDTSVGSTPASEAPSSAHTVPRLAGFTRANRKAGHESACDMLPFG